jgi:peptidyl-prolyl cis-trans isomerase C
MARSGRAAVVLVLVLSLAACRSATQKSKGAAPTPSASAEQAVVAEFGGKVLTRGELDARMARLPPRVRALYASDEARRKLLAEMVKLEVLAAEARRRGFDRRPDLKVRISELLVEEMTSSLFGEEGDSAPKISDEDVERYYAEHSAEFHTPEERSASDILLGDRATAERILRAAAARPHDYDAFRKLAREEGRDPALRARDGNLGFVSKSSLGRPPPEVCDAVFALAEVGDLAPQVVASQDGFHVLKLTGVRPAIDRSIDEVRTLIRARLTEQRRAEAVARFTDELEARARVRLYPDRLGTAPGAASAAAESAPANSAVQDDVP